MNTSSAVLATEAHQGSAHRDKSTQQRHKGRDLNKDLAAVQPQSRHRATTRPLCPQSPLMKNWKMINNNFTGPTAVNEAWVHNNRHQRKRTVPVSQDVQLDKYHSRFPHYIQFRGIAVKQQGILQSFWNADVHKHTHTQRQRKRNREPKSLQWVTLSCKSADEHALAAITGDSSNAVSIELLTCGSFSLQITIKKQSAWNITLPQRDDAHCYTPWHGALPHTNSCIKNAQCDAEFLDLCLVRYIYIYIYTRIYRYIYKLQ